jgi:hypothetical protein
MILERRRCVPIAEKGLGFLSQTSKYHNVVTACHYHNIKSITDIKLTP